MYNLDYNELINKHGTILGQQHHPVMLPLLTMPSLPPITPGTQDIEVKRNQTRTLSPG
ncbi:MAG TPA: hypothetical protein VN643_25230 [Pyrinomonadaceae bacterium]|nr:hypothetical protein [Pyrinomonadaceae bacterium]